MSFIIKILDVYVNFKIIMVFCQMESEQHNVYHYSLLETYY